MRTIENYLYFYGRTANLTVLPAISFNFKIRR
ncbi:hypothetical protein SAMN05421739_10374 [Pontibacter chinhatensis]|uniref:Uncharacterized protein n=1 Tax=Pontibacter chinhatensis TaxID=1436961 RepID=A0A1I2TCK8_9BACT|nr:hypothetical protein SAMN05421739_10374 [Pontibacter chinhatensis]